MQLILDAETTIDIKRNMSTLNEETLTEKLDVIQDLKSGLCNGNKENIQSHDNKIASDEKPLENDKVEDPISSKSPMPDDGIEKSMNMEVNDSAGENISTKDTENENITFEESTHNINENKSSPIKATINVVDISNLIRENVVSFDEIQEPNNSENIEEQSVSQNNNASSNDLECQPAVEQTENREEMTENVGKVEVSDKVENAQKAVVQEVDVKVDDVEKVGVDEKIAENLDHEVKSYDKVEIGESLEHDKSKFQEKEIVEDALMVEKVNLHVEENVKAKNDNEKTENPDAKEENNDSFQLMSDNNVTSEAKEADNEDDTVTKKCIQASTKQEVPVASPKKLTEQNENTSCDHEESHNENVKIDINKFKTKDTEEIETVNLDDEEKETESLGVCLDIINIDGEFNVQNETNNGSDSAIEKKEKIVTDMETVDLDDDKDDGEPMDVDINGEAGETLLNELPVSKSAENENVLALGVKDNHESSLSTTGNNVEKTENIELKNKVTPMDEDLHPAHSESCDKSVSKKDVKEIVSSEPVTIQDDELNELKKSGEPTEEISKQSNQETKVADGLKNVPSILKLSNTLDILSDDEDEVKESQKSEHQPQNKIVENDADKKCISIDDDDDIMLIDEEDTNRRESKNEPVKTEAEIAKTEIKVESETIEKTVEVKSPQKISEAEKVTENEKVIKEENVIQPVSNTEEKKSEVKPELPKPLVPNDFFKTCKKNMAEMTRDDLEEFCILKIVESVVDRSSLSEIKTKLKSMAQCVEEYKKKAMMLTKQNRDLQVVLKTIQEEQKNSKTVTPLKITRSVGMQVLMTERSNVRRKPPGPPMINNNNTTPTKSPRVTNQRAIKVPAAPSPQQIPVPRLIPASNSPAAKTNMQQITANNTGKAASPVNGVRNQPKAEKRTIARNQSVTVDLTEDEPPTKIVNRNSTPTPVRVVPPHLVPQNLLSATQRHPIGQSNNPRKVYIPISGPQNPNARPGQAIMLKSVTTPNQGPRPRVPQPHMTRLPNNHIRMTRVQSRHPAPLPESNKIYPGNYLKALPPAPDLKLSKVENGIVISWKIEGYQEDSYEEIASYQLYAYQETNAPPSTALWKKIGDVKALPLPMACTLTQFMAGFKYYFAVRAVDIRSRIGPFSLPGSILLLNKL